MMDFGDLPIALLAVLFAPVLLSLLSQSGKAITLALLCSAMAFLLREDDYGAVVFWTIGMMVAIVAIYIRFAEMTPIEPDQEATGWRRQLARVRSKIRRRRDSGC